MSSRKKVWSEWESYEKLKKIRDYWRKWRRLIMWCGIRLVNLPVTCFLDWIGPSWLCLHCAESCLAVGVGRNQNISNVQLLLHFICDKTMDYTKLKENVQKTVPDHPAWWGGRTTQRTVSQWCKLVAGIVSFFSTLLQILFSWTGGGGVIASNLHKVTLLCVICLLIRTINVTITVNTVLFQIKCLLWCN